MRWLAPLLLLAILLSACGPLAAKTSNPAASGPAATLTAWRLPRDTPPPAAAPAQSARAEAAAPANLSGSASLAISADQAGQPRQMPAEPPERPVAGTPRPTASPALPIPSPTPAWNPTVASDLLFLADQQLVRWDPVSQASEVLAEKVVDFATSPYGHGIVLLRQADIVANGVERFDLELLDLQSGQTSRLVTATPRLYHLALSADGQRLAYVEQPEGGEVYTLRLPAPGQGQAESTIHIGTCQPGNQPGCTLPAWSPDGISLLWLDERGAWLSNLKAGDAQLVQPVRITVNDPRGGTSEIEVRFSLASWSPQGRFALLTVAPLASQVSWQAVLDTRAGRLVMLPDSYRQSELESSAAWLLNGDIALAHAGGPPAHSIPYVRRYQVLATRQELLIPQRTYDLFLPPAETSTLFCPTWLAQPASPNLLFVLQATSPSANPSLYRLDLERGVMELLGEAPFAVTGLSWASDGHGVLLLGAHGQAVFIPLGRAPVDLRPLLGKSLNPPGPDASPHFTWTTPRPRQRPTAIP